MNEVQQFAYDFVKENWEKIDKKKVDLDTSTKAKTLKEIKKDETFAGWIICEVMDWGCDKNYLEQYEVPNEDFSVWRFGNKVKNKFYRLAEGKFHRLIESKQKFKMVTYFE